MSSESDTDGGQEWDQQPQTWEPRYETPYMPMSLSPQHSLSDPLYTQRTQYTELDP